MSDSLVEGDRGVGDQKKRGQERAESRSRNKEGNSLLFITGYYSVKNTSLAKF